MLNVPRASLMETLPRAKFMLAVPREMQVALRKGQTPWSCVLCFFCLVS